MKIKRKKGPHHADLEAVMMITLQKIKKGQNTTTMKYSDIPGQRACVKKTTDLETTLFK